MNIRKLEDLSKEELIELIKHERGEPEYRISACYFPKVGEVELTWERQYDGAEAHLTFKATPDQGKHLVSVIDPCVYYTAAPQPVTSAQEPSDDAIGVLKLALEYWADRQQRYRNRAPVWVQEARALLAHYGAAQPSQLSRIP